MPELPEVHTTATILHRLIKGKVIKDVWTDYNSPYYKGKSNIKDPRYFTKFSKSVRGKKVVRVWRRAKNVLIDIEGGQTILIHMKMTGHLLYGPYKKVARPKSGEFGWKAADDAREGLKNSFSRFIHLVFTLDDGNHLAFSDMRKFATVKLISDKESLAAELRNTGPEPLDPKFDWRSFKNALLKKPAGKIKTVLMDVSVVAGIGNIYSDEILWSSRMRPDRLVKKITDDEFKTLHKHTQRLLSKGIDFGGDSMSDYRNPYGEKGAFQLHHQAYRRTGEKCLHKGCGGTMERRVIAGRSAHFCNKCQK